MPAALVRNRRAPSKSIRSAAFPKSTNCRVISILIGAKLVDMGEVLCAIHGPCGGPLCCVHISEAASGLRSLTVSGAVCFSVDLCDDGRLIGEHIVCLDCAAPLGFQDGSRYGSSVWESDRFPNVGPTCETCIEQWRARQCMDS